MATLSDFEDQIPAPLDITTQEANYHTPVLQEGSWESKGRRTNKWANILSKRNEKPNIMLTQTLPSSGSVPITLSKEKTRSILLKRRRMSEVLKDLDTRLLYVEEKLKNSLDCHLTKKTKESTTLKDNGKEEKKLQTNHVDFIFNSSWSLKAKFEWNKLEISSAALADSIIQDYGSDLPTHLKDQLITLAKNVLDLGEVLNEEPLEVTMENLPEQDNY